MIELTDMLELDGTGDEDVEDEDSDVSWYD
jgi:hypothetical protein